MHCVVSMKGPSSAFAVSWSPLLLLLLLPMVKMSPTSLPKHDTPEAVSKLINSSSVKFNLSNYFAELKLQDGCTSPLINESNFLDSLMSHYESSMCTIIYNLTKELEVIGKEGILDNLVESPKNINEPHDEWFTIWKNVSEISKSPSLNLLMKHLNEIKKWKSVCYNFDGNLFPYCKFLHHEVLLLQIVEKKRAVKVSSNTSSSINASSNNVINQLMASDKSLVNSKDNEVSIATTISINDSNIETDDNKDDSDDGLNSSIDVPTPINKENRQSNSIDENQDVDSDIINSPDKIAQPIYSSSKKLTNRQEESHFLFYFIIMTIFFMMFYLALYNKKKIIALLIEGRRSTNHRRRPNSTSYSKVETDDTNTVY